MFQCEGLYHIVYPFLSGGDIFFHLSNCGKFTEELVRHYSAQIVLALGYLHDRCIVYNDLKPENVMLDKDGFLKLSRCRIGSNNKKIRSFRLLFYLSGLYDCLKKSKKTVLLFSSTPGVVLFTSLCLFFLSDPTCIPVCLPVWPDGSLDSC